MSNFLDYLRDISNGAPNTEFARVTGVNKSTVGRWDHIAPSLDAVRALARHYGKPVIEVMVRAELIDPRDVNATVQANLTEFSNHALLREIERRMGPQTSDAPETISSPADYGEEPTPDDYDLAAGKVARDPRSH